MTRKETQRAPAAHFPTFDLASASLSDAAPSAALTPFQALLKRLSAAYGPSGSEDPVRELVRAELKGLADQIRTDAFGNLIALRKGAGSGRKKIMLAAPLDEIGVMVTFIDARGFARFDLLGAVNPLTLLGARAQFENGAIGIFGRETRGAPRAEIETDALFLDLGAAAADALPVQVGAAACLTGEFRAADNFLYGKALGGRASCAVLLETWRRLKRVAHDVYCVFTVQSASAQDFPGGNSNLALGQGPAIVIQDQDMVASAAARQILLQTARRAALPYQIQARATHGGDGAPIQAAREGIVTGALGLPVRYLHTPSEMAHASDIENTIELLCGVLSNKTL